MVIYAGAAVLGRVTISRGAPSAAAYGSHSVPAGIAQANALDDRVVDEGGSGRMTRFAATGGGLQP